MSITLKGAVSAAALLIAISAAHAQTNERPQGEGRQQGGGQQQQERGGQDRPEARPNDKQQDGKAERGQSAEKPDGKSAQGQSQEKRESGQDKRDGDRSAQDKPDRDNRQGDGASDRKDGPSQASRPDKADGKREKHKISVSAEQRPRYRDAIKRHSNIKRYNRSEVNFTINLGSRIPDTYVFYDAPAEFYEIDADFREYKIIVLDDVILVVDPDTREIVEVISI